MIKDQELFFFFSVPEVEVCFINDLLGRGVKELLSLGLLVGSVIVFSLFFLLGGGGGNVSYRL